MRTVHAVPCYNPHDRHVGAKEQELEERLQGAMRRLQESQTQLEAAVKKVKEVGRGSGLVTGLINLGLVF